MRFARIKTSELAPFGHQFRRKMASIGALRSAWHLARALRPQPSDQRQDVGQDLPDRLGTRFIAPSTSRTSGPGYAGRLGLFRKNEIRLQSRRTRHKPGIDRVRFGCARPVRPACRQLVIGYRLRPT
jgi:hypothetical protein